jgi:hypothetical protein
MVARLNREMFRDASFTPRPDSSDSDDVLLALETARALEVKGALREAARCLRRAAEDAEKSGNDARVLVLARAAADMTNAIGPASLAAGSEPPPPSRATPVPPLLAALVSSVRPLFQRAPSPPEHDVAASPSETPAQLPLAAPPTPEAKPADRPLTERRMRIGAVRVAVKDAAGEARSFDVERLEAGQPLPAGTREAMLVFTGEIDGSLQIETFPRVSKR